MAKKLGEWTVRFRTWILLIAVLLLIPSVIGYARTKVNYDLLVYLPKDIETMAGQEILQEEFGSGGFSMLVCEGMQEKDVSDLKKKITAVDGVKDVIWYDTAMDINVPMELLDFKFRVMKWKGYKLVEPPITARSNFLRDLEVPINADDYEC